MKPNRGSKGECIVLNDPSHFPPKRSIVVDDVGDPGDPIEVSFTDFFKPDDKKVANGTDFV